MVSLSKSVRIFKKGLEEVIFRGWSRWFFGPQKTPLGNTAAEPLGGAVG